MEFGVLGRVAIRTTGDWITTGGPRQQLLLAALVLESGRVMPFGTLAARVWDGSPPGLGHAALWPHVSRLRRWLAAGPGEAAELEHTPGGYLLRVAPDQVDAHRFAGLLAAARRCRSDQEAVDQLDAAVALWRGEPLSGLPGEWAAAARAGLQQQRVEALVLRGAALVRLGRAESALPALLELAEEHPLVESVLAALVRALAAAGRRAEALERYRHTQRMLSRELGIDPGAELAAAHQEALSRPPVIPNPGPAVLPAPAGSPSLPAVPRPAQLPPAVPGLTGRGAELAWLDRAAGAAPVPAVVTGPGGVGKTALVLHWAHRACDAFPDGQLYVDLRGYDPELPVPAAEALAAFLHALGVPAPQVPADPQARAARFRSEVSGRRMLVVLDNAAGVDQVRPLLPGSGPAVLVTSRDTMAGLVAVNGARRLELGMLPPDEAVRLLRVLDVPVDAEPAAATELASACAGLPLALRVAAELTSAGGPAPVAALVRELADHDRRMDVLRIPGDGQGRVDTVFSWSYLRLPAELARAFRLLSLHPAEAVEAYGLAALSGTSLAHSRQSLDLLRRANLLEPAGSGRFRMHDLLRAYARHLSDRHDGPAAQDTAFGQLSRYYLICALTATDLLYPSERGIRPAPPPATSPLPPLTERAAALAWLDEERPALRAVIAMAADRGRAGDVAGLSRAVYLYLMSGPFPEAEATYDLALRVAVQAGRPRDQAEAQRAAAMVSFNLGRGPAARDGLLVALELFGRLGELVGQARCEANLGLVLTQLGDLTAALEHLERGRSMYERAGHPAGQARALMQTGVVRLKMGRPDEESLAQALTLYREVGDRGGMACTLSNQAFGLHRMGRLAEAEGVARQAVEIHREVGAVDGEAVTLGTLGLIQAETGRLEQALATLRQALGMHLRTGNRESEGEARNDLGVALALAGDLPAAVREHTAALALATEAGDRIEQARGHQRLAALLPAGDPERARHRAASLELRARAGLGGPEESSTPVGAAAGRPPVGTTRR